MAQLVNASTIKTYFNKEEFHDVLIEDTASKRQYKLHKIILASYSKFFEELFKAHPQIKSVRLPLPVRSVQSQSKDYYESVLKFIYSEDKSSKVFEEDGLSFTNCNEFYSHLSALRVESGEQLLSEYILSHTEDSDFCFKLLIDGIKLSNKNFQEQALKRIAQKFSDIVSKQLGMDAVKKIPIEQFIYLLEQSDLNVTTETELFKAIVEYVKEWDNPGLPTREEEAKMAQSKGGDENKNENSRVNESSLQPGSNPQPIPKQGADGTGQEEAKVESDQAQKPPEDQGQDQSKGPEEQPQQDPAKDAAQQEQPPEKQEEEQKADESSLKPGQGEAEKPVPEASDEPAQVDLELAAQGRLKKYRMTPDQKRRILSQVQLENVDNDQLTQASKLDIFASEKD